MDLNNQAKGSSRGSNPPPFFPPASLSSLVRAMRLILHSAAILCAVLACCLGKVPVLHAELPAPVLQTIFPAGAQAGTTVTATIEGTALEGLRELRSSAPGFAAEKIEGNRFNISVASTTPPGIYDLRAVTDYGVSNPRAFAISHCAEIREVDSNDAIDAATSVELNAVVNGKIEKPGDVDSFRFAAKAGQRVVIECWAERIDSQLRGVIEVFNDQGQRLAVSRGHTGLDPLVDLRVPVDGWYDVRLFDLSYLGGNAHFYRLDFDTLARPEFALPCVVERGQTARVKLFGRNLLPSGSSSAADFDVVEVDVTPPSETATFIPLPRRPSPGGCGRRQLQPGRSQLDMIRNRRTCELICAVANSLEERLLLGKTGERSGWYTRFGRLRAGDKTPLF